MLRLIELDRLIRFYHLDDLIEYPLWLHVCIQGISDGTFIPMEYDRYSSGASHQILDHRIPQISVETIVVGGTITWKHFAIVQNSANALKQLPFATIKPMSPTSLRISTGDDATSLNQVGTPRTPLSIISCLPPSPVGRYHEIPPGSPIKTIINKGIHGDHASYKNRQIQFIT